MLAGREISLAIALSCATGTLLPTAAGAAGFLFYEVGTQEVGLRLRRLRCTRREPVASGSPTLQG